MVKHLLLQLLPQQNLIINIDTYKNKGYNSKMNYKIYVAGFIESTQQLLVSFSCDDTKHEATVYQSLAFDVVPYGDMSVTDILKQIAKQAPVVCKDIIMAEKVIDNSERAEEFRSLVGKDFVYKHKDLVITDAVQLLKETAPEAVESETL